MKRFKKIFTSAVMFMTVVVMSGLTAPVATKAAAQAGDLIKKDGLSAVYYLGEDGKRYVFPNESTYKSWYSDFSGVVTVSSDELASYPLGANVVVRPGTKLVKITTDPKVYAVEANGTLRWVQTEADAIALYGANWASRVIDVADSFFTNYTIGTPLASNEVPQGSLVQKTGESSIYYYDGTDYRMIEDEVAFLANRFQFENVLTVDSFTAGGSTITGAESSIIKTSQGGQATGWQPGQGTGVTVALNSMTPAAQSVPSTVGRIPFTKVNVTASADGATHLESITVKRTGLTGEWTTFKVWAEKDGVAVTSKRSLTTSDDAVLTFAPVLVIPAGQTATLEILAEVAGVTGNGALEIASASAVSAAGATVSGSFPITGNLMSFTTYNVTALEFATTTIANTTLKVGDEDVELAKFDIDITKGSSTRDVVFKTLTLRNNGVEDLASVVMNLHLENAGEKVSENATFNGRYATFTLLGNGMDLLKDDGSYEFVVKGDIIGKDNSGTDSIQLRLNKKDELYAYEKATGFGVTYLHNDGLEFSAVKIESGAVDLSKKSTSPSTQDVIKNTKNVTALVANVKADEAISADSFKVYYNGYENSFQNVKVFLNGALLGSFDLATNATSGVEKSELIESSLNLNKGNNEIKVTVDVKTNASTTEDFAVTIKSDFLTAGSPEYVSNGLSVSDINGTASGSKITVSGGGMTIAKNDGYADGRKAVEGTTDVSLAKFAVKATNDNIKLTNIVLGGNSSATGATTSESHVYDMKLFVDGVQIGTTRNLTASGATFASLNYNIAKNKTKVIELKGSLTSEAAGDATTTLKLKATVNAQDSLGKTIEAQSVDTAMFEVTKGGSLTVAKGANSPYSTILIAKAGLEQEIAQFRLTAVDDSANVTELVLENKGLASSSDDRISSLKIYDGATLLDSAVMIDGAATFYISNNKLVVPANGSKTITVKATFNSIELANETGKQLLVAIQSGSVKAKASSGAELSSINVTDAVANHMFIRKTKPTFAKVSGVTGGAAVEQEMLRFTVAADANEDISINALTFALNGTGVASTGVIGIYELGNPKILATSTSASSTFAALNVEISKDSSKTFRVVADTTKIGTDATVGVSLNNSAVGNIAWGEYFVGGNATSTGTYLTSFPIDGGTMKY